MQDFQTFLAPAKINLFLHIVGRRADGYHLLQSVFQLLDFYDIIRIKTTAHRAVTRINTIAGVAENDDLCVRAAKKLQQYANSPLGCELIVEKHIPMGGGLGGGSSDAATVLLALNRLWQLNLSHEILMEIGLTLGADVPFFIFGENAWAEGIGEILSPIVLEPAYYVVLTPSTHVSTAEIFGNSRLTKDTKALRIADFSTWSISGDATSSLFRNDLEGVVCELFPEVATAIKWLGHFGDVRMSGSGASVFLATVSQEKAEEILVQRPPSMAGFVAKGLQKHPMHR